MPKDNKKEVTPRHLLVSLLAKKFTAQYRDIIKHYQSKQQLELTEHLLVVLEFLKQCANCYEKIAYPKLVAKEDVLLKKYGKLLKPYKDCHFEKYFEITEEFNRLPLEEQGLNVNEILQFVQICSNWLSMELQLLLLIQEPSFNVKDDSVKGLPFDVEQEEEAGKEFAKARQLLTLHYLLSAGFGIEPRNEISLSSLTRFAHLITGTPFTNLQNSEMYKKYRMMPNFKKGLVGSLTNPFKIYQKALAKPDINIGTEYDQRSSYNPNYVGLAVSVPLNFFNKNQGNIKSVQY